MAIFGSNRCSVLEGINIEADMSYSGIEGCARALREAKENDQAMFVGIITNDIQSVLTEEWETRQAINEATVKGIWDSIVRIFEKLAAKIKGIIANATAKFTAFINDAEKLYKQYGKVLKDKDLSNATIKIREFDADAYKSMSAITPNSFTLDTLFEKNTSGTPEEVAKALVANALPSAYVDAKNADKGSADKAFDSCFKKEAEVAVTTDGWVKSCLTKSFLTEIIKDNKATEAAIAKLVKDAKKNLDKVTKANATNASKNQSEESKKAMDAGEEVASRAVQAASRFQTEIITFTTARLNAAKKASIQAKKVFMCAVSYKAKKSDKAEAEKEAKTEGFEFVEECCNFAGLYNILGESSYLEVADLVEYESEIALS